MYRSKLNIGDETFGFGRNLVALNYYERVYNEYCRWFLHETPIYSVQLIMLHRVRITGGHVRAQSADLVPSGGGSVDDVLPSLPPPRARIADETPPSVPRRRPHRARTLRDDDRLGTSATIRRHSPRDLPAVSYTPRLTITENPQGRDNETPSSLVTIARFKTATGNDAVYRPRRLPVPFSRRT